ncbi:hydrogenase expression/formation protein HypE [Candidatus Desantisbacteria bacterium]|nr:hydrogenase expression/formation protein HypE [Candidatus Desantisbacteria bacterium]
MSSDKILLAHGSGGKLTHRLINEVFLEAFKNEMLEELNDSAIFHVDEGKLAYTTDSYVVDPIFFPGGDIGRLAICGTVNDLAMSGAKPLYLSASFIIEEGLSTVDLRKIVRSMSQAANEAGVEIVCGDTKVVARGAADKIFITTSGIGLIPHGIEISPKKIMIGDEIIISGTIGDHGIAILSQREGLEFNLKLLSDVALLNHLVASIIDAAGNEIHALRDPTRGGVATTLNEFAQAANSGIRIYEDRIPVRDEVKGVCELLGFDPLYVANEGKLVVVTSNASEVLSCLKGNSLGINARIIGEVVEQHKGTVSLVTRIGGTRIVDMLTGEQLPRIC